VAADKDIGDFVEVKQADAAIAVTKKARIYFSS